MKKLFVPSYIARTKWAVVLIIGITLIIFGRTVESPSLIKSAIVLGIGIDFDEESAEFDVTTQSVLVGIAGGQDSQSTYALYDAKGKTIADALDKISRKMGLLVSLAHCNVLFVSQNVLKLDHLQLIYPLTGMYALPEQAILATGEQSPKEIMALRIGTTLSAPFFLQQALINEEGSDGMLRTTVKDFAARSLSRSGASALPYIVAEKMEHAPMTEGGNDASTYETDMSRALVFNHEKTALLEGEYSELLALFISRDVVGTLNYTADDGGTMEFKILGKQVSLKANGTRLFASIKLFVDLSDVQHVPTDKVLSSADPVVKDYANRLAAQFENRFVELYETSKSTGIDFLNLQDKAYQSVGRTLPENCLDELSFSASVTISVQETA
ncbi:MAG: hypothetical protein ACI4MZ_03000 [Christensenellales bacterium]